MSEPRLRNVSKVKPPYPINEFPHNFIVRFGAEVVYMLASKPVISIEGEEWEQIFAHCIDAEWKPSNVGLDDVQLGNCCWSAKTVFSSSKDLKKLKKVRLICGRNSPTYSYGVDSITNSPPDDIGRMVLEIWNERVSSIRQIFKFARTIVLVKSKDFSEYLIFEADTIRFDPELYYFKWNTRGNLEGYDKATNSHKFTWQPHGSQFTVVEDIPAKKLHIKLKKPNPIDQNLILKVIGYDESWVTVAD